MASETTNINLDVFNVVGDGNMDFQTWSQKIAGEVDSNMVKIDDAIGTINNEIGTINGEIDTLASSLAVFSEFTNRQGASATNWSDHGSNNYVVSGAKIQFGSKPISVPQAEIVFPVAFSNPPLIIWSVNNIVNSALGTVWADRFTFLTDDATGYGFLNWIAIGPE
jgi:hypothetical protein